jgi:hypothetical protein
LLEVMLAASIGVILLWALYSTLGAHMKNAEIGRDLAERSTLARAVMNRMSDDIGACLNLDDAARFRYSADAKAYGIGQSSSSSSANTANSSTTNNSTTNNSSTNNSTNGSTNTTTNATGASAVTLPMGVMGDTTQLTVLIGKAPREVWQADPNAQLGLSDMRLVSYWYVPGMGLCRQEIKPVTSPDAFSQLPPNAPNDPGLVLAPEVTDLQFRYWDGSAWQDTWDSTTPGADGVTPIGPPLAVEITLSLTKPRPADAGDDYQEPEPETYRHVVAIATANGTTVMQQPASSTTTSGSTGSGSGTSP